MTKQEAAKGLGVRCTLCGTEYPSVDWIPYYNKPGQYCGHAGICKGIVEPMWKDGIMPELTITPSGTPNGTICPVCKTKYSYPHKGSDKQFVCETQCWKTHKLPQRPFLVEDIPGSPTKPILMSFSYKGGIPEGIGPVIDVRNTIRNPWRDPALRPLNGLHPDVQAYVAKCFGAKKLLSATYYNSMRVGCMGGRHRSVAIVELIAAKMRDSGLEVEVIHRDLKGAANDDAAKAGESGE